MGQQLRVRDNVLNLQDTSWSYFAAESVAKSVAKSVGKSRSKQTVPVNTANGRGKDSEAVYEMLGHSVF